jgi:hypothetical protein
MGQVRVTQQGLSFLGWDFFRNRRKRICRSECTGMFLQPCSKLWMALRETPNSRAIWICVFPSCLRIIEKVLFCI